MGWAFEGKQGFSVGALVLINCTHAHPIWDVPISPVHRWSDQIKEGQELALASPLRSLGTETRDSKPDSSLSALLLSFIPSSLSLHAVLSSQTAPQLLQARPPEEIWVGVGEMGEGILLIWEKDIAKTNRTRQKGGERERERGRGKKEELRAPVLLLASLGQACERAREAGLLI
ncbi:hypothetical protein JZ751_028993 [Albula glossodonta]|uniref:Uncharacterized protein n=1 Tax=Albula glossodonta TaxID=121402 RepID=A0A8T2PAC6_9TELE|nr:hypothetical protein JZ751_028993 [Albula glossodonta]